MSREKRKLEKSWKSDTMRFVGRGAVSAVIVTALVAAVLIIPGAIGTGAIGINPIGTGGHGSSASRMGLLGTGGHGSSASRMGLLGTGGNGSSASRMGLLGTGGNGIGASSAELAGSEVSRREAFGGDGTEFADDFAQAMGLSASALSTAFNCEVYNPKPMSMTLSKGKSQSIKKVYKYAYRIKNKETFSSLKNAIKGVSGKAYKVTYFSWVPADESIVKISSKGKVTGLKKGTTYIYPIRNTVCSYKVKGKYVLYTDLNILDGLKISGAFAMKVKVK